MLEDGNLPDDWAVLRKAASDPAAVDRLESPPPESMTNAVERYGIGAALGAGLGAGHTGTGEGHMNLAQ